MLRSAGHALVTAAAPACAETAATGTGPRPRRPRPC